MRRASATVAATAALLAATAVAAVLAGCGQRPSSSDDASVVQAGDRATQGGLFEYYVQQVARTTPEALDPGARQRLGDDLEKLQAAARVAEASQDTATRYALELQRLELLAKAGAARAGVFNEPAEAEVEAAYDAFVAELPASEYRVAHILVPTESDALGIIARLGAGADFSEVAREESADDSRSSGGDIGWLHPGTLPQEFTDAVQSLEQGQYTRRPVKTPYGWHVIKLLDTRRGEVPPLERVHAQVVANVVQERYRQYLDRVWREQQGRER